MPELTNRSGFEAAVVPAISAEGHTLGVVIVKATYALDEHGAMSLAPQQEEILYADAMDRQTGRIRVPSDFVDRKPGTEVVIVPPEGRLRASAYAGRELAVRFGSLVIEGKVGDGWPFGPLERAEEPRRRYAGTYDEEWIRERMPLLPLDFDPRHHFCVPAAQQLEGYALGDESLVLANFHARPRLDARLPGLAVVVASDLLGEYFARLSDLDTVVIWSDLPRVQLVWRLAIRTRQKFEEIGDVFVDAVEAKAARELFAGP